MGFWSQWGVIAAIFALSAILPSTHGYNDGLQRRQAEGDSNVLFYQRAYHSCQ